MTAMEYLSDARRRGLVFVRTGESLSVRPRERITPEDKVAIPQHKAEILDYLDLLEEITDSQPWHPEPPPGAEIIVADADGRTPSHGKKMGESFMWTWIGGKTWYYVKSHPIPANWRQPDESKITPKRVAS